VVKILFAFLAVFFLAQSEEAHAGHPFRGVTRWSVLLCSFFDSPAPVRTPAAFNAMLFQRGSGGVADYYAQVSRDAVSLEGTVRGWFTIAMPTNSVKAFSHGGPGGNRDLSFQLCVDAARAGGFTPPAGDSIAVVTSPGIDSWGGGGRAYLGVEQEIAAYMHEMSHGLGLQHSWSDNVSAPCGGALNEYHDAFDIMSWSCETIGVMTPFGFGGPGFNAFHLDRMGWLSRGEIMVFGSDGRTSGPVTLTALYRSGFGGTRLVRIPYDPNDLNSYFTVELRMPVNWDAGFGSPVGSPVVLIHDSRPIPVPPNWHASFLQRKGVDGPPAEFLLRNGVTIEVLSIDAAQGIAHVFIASEFAKRCLAGYVWREAGPNDFVCVTGQNRTTARDENMLAPSRRSPTGGAFGPNTCVFGFVWREAFAGDFACVPSAARTRVRQENQDGPSHTNPARFLYGPNSCAQGYVWREADGPGGRDYVCVVGSTRAETMVENTLAPLRRVGATTACQPGYVWREAYGRDDQTCVSPASRARAAADNLAAESWRAPF